MRSCDDFMRSGVEKTRPDIAIQYICIVKFNIRLFFVGGVTYSSTDGISANIER